MHEIELHEIELHEIKLHELELHEIELEMHENECMFGTGRSAGDQVPFTTRTLIWYSVIV